MQHKFCRVNRTGRSWRAWKTPKLTSSYLNGHTSDISKKLLLMPCRICEPLLQKSKEQKKSIPLPNWMQCEGDKTLAKPLHKSFSSPSSYSSLVVSSSSSTLLAHAKPERSPKNQLRKVSKYMKGLITWDKCWKKQEVFKHATTCFPLLCTSKHITKNLTIQFLQMSTCLREWSHKQRTQGHLFSWEKTRCV